jgi:hypothetical protein
VRSVISSVQLRGSAGGSVREGTGFLVWQIAGETDGVCVCMSGVLCVCVCVKSQHRRIKF